MNALRLLILSTILLMMISSRVHCATKKVKIKLYKISRKQNKAPTMSINSLSSLSGDGQQTMKPPSPPPPPSRRHLQLNVDQLIEHGEALISETVQWQMRQLEEKPEPEKKPPPPLPPSLLSLALRVYGSLVASLAACQARPRSCAHRLNFATLHSHLRTMAYYEERIAEEVDIARRRRTFAKIV